MGLLLGDPDFKQHIENRLALDFQFSGQIVDSNLAHPLRFLRTIPLSLHINLTVSVFRRVSNLHGNALRNFTLAARRKAAPPPILLLEPQS
jgi:hypothetical protein